MSTKNIFKFFGAANENERENTVIVLVEAAALVIFYRLGLEDHYFSIPIGNQSVEEISKGLNVLFENLGPIHLTVCLPRSMVLTRITQLPDGSPDELQSMFEMESTQLFPLPRDQIYTSFKPIQKLSNGFLQIEAYALPIEKINDILKILGPWNDQLILITLSSDALDIYLNAKSLLNPRKNQIFLDFWENTVELLGYQEGHPFFSRTIVSPRNKGNHLLDEVIKSIKTFTSALDNKSAYDVTLVGVSPSISPLKTILEEKLGINIEVVNTATSSLTRIPSVLQGALEMGGRARINFLPKDLANVKRDQQTQQRWIHILALIGGIALFLLGAFYTRFIDKKIYLSALQKVVDEQQPRAAKMDRLIAYQHELEDIFDEKRDPLNIFWELHQIIPRSTSLQIIDFDAQRGLTLHGRDRRYDRAVSLVKILEESKYFEGVELKSSSERKQSTGKFIEFRIHCPFAGDTP